MTFSFASSGRELNNAFVLILLAAGLALSLTTSAMAATIVIEVQAQGGDAVFPFNSDPGDFEVASEGGQGRHLLEGLSPGQYEVSTGAPDGWSVLGIMCHDPAASIDFATSRVVFQLAEDDSVACSFIFRVQ